MFPFLPGYKEAQSKIYCSVITRTYLLSLAPPFDTGILLSKLFIIVTCLNSASGSSFFVFCFFSKLEPPLLSLLSITRCEFKEALAAIYCLTKVTGKFPLMSIHCPIICSSCLFQILEATGSWRFRDNVGTSNVIITVNLP